MHLISIFTSVLMVGITIATHGNDLYLEYGQNDTHYACLARDVKDPLRKNAEGFCECDEGLFRHDSLNRCVSPPNGKCTFRSRDGHPIRTCTEYAMCWSSEPVNQEHPRQDGICHCEPDAKIDLHTGLCKLKHGSSRCNKLTDCDIMSLVTCRYSSCQCQDNEFQTYNRTAGRCEALVGGTCGVSAPPFPAAQCHGPNMKCEDHKCVCEDGYAQTHDKKCAKLTKTTHICQGGGHYPMAPMPMIAMSKTQDAAEVAEKNDGEEHAGEKEE